MTAATRSAAFRDPAREREADVLGMWIFLGSEALLFGAMMLVYLTMRLLHGEAFAHGSGELSIWLGTTNTAVLLTSSLAMALADAAVEGGRQQSARRLLAATALLGCVFLAIKLYEYHDEAAKGLLPVFGLPFRYDGPAPQQVELFFHLYVALTGLHAAHLLSGILVVGAVALAWRRTAPASRRRRTAAIGLYWHFIDVIWVFLYPILYLVRP